MNVIELMGMDSPKYGGLEIFNIELLKYANARGDKIIFVYESKPTEYDYINDIEKYGGRLIILNSRKNKTKFSYLLLKLIKKERIDILHAHFTPARFVAIPLLYYFTDVKSVQTIHSSIKTIKKKTKLFYKLFLMKQCFTIAVSKEIKNDCVNLFGDNIEITTSYLGVNKNNFCKEEARRHLNIKQSEIIVLSIGNFNHIKGYDILVNAVFSLLQDNFLTEEIKFIILGQPLSEREELQSIIDKLHLTKYFNLLGIRNDIAIILKSADIYCQPSRTEGMPLSLMEALAAGLPIIASNVGGISEIVHNSKNGILTRPESISDLSSALRTLLASTEKRQAYADYSSTGFEYFRIEEAIKRLYSIYNNLIFTKK